MLVVDASALYEVISEGEYADNIREILLTESDLAAPQLIDVEVMGLLRRDTQAGVLHESRSAIAIEELNSWPGERFAHELFNQRVWELRFNIRTWDAYYVALAEALQVSLITLDARLARATGPKCHFIVPVGG